MRTEDEITGGGGSRIDDEQNSCCCILGVRVASTIGSLVVGEWSSSSSRVQSAVTAFASRMGDQRLTSTNAVGNKTRRGESSRDETKRPTQFARSLARFFVSQASSAFLGCRLLLFCRFAALVALFHTHSNRICCCCCRCRCTLLLCTFCGAGASH